MNKLSIVKTRIFIEITICFITQTDLRYSIISNSKRCYNAKSKKALIKNKTDFPTLVTDCQ